MSIALLLYGGGAIEDRPLLVRRMVRRIFGRVRIPDPTTLRALAEAGQQMHGLLLDVLFADGWSGSAGRWFPAASRSKLTLMLDSIVVVRHGERHVAVDAGCNPTKRDCPSQQRLVAFVMETGECLGGAGNPAMVTRRWEPNGGWGSR